jgi:hypothetical protein
MNEAEPLKVFLSGEGRCELGSRAGDRFYQNDDEPGVLQKLLRRTRPEGWIVGGACDWKSIRKFRTGVAGHADTRNVLGAAKDAKDSGCRVLAFVRDRDNDRERPAAIEAGMKRIEEKISNPPAVVGGVAIPKLEGWILAMLGEKDTEKMSPGKAERILENKKGISKSEAGATKTMVRVVETADLVQLPTGCDSLKKWLELAGRHL